jgi:uncharacterized protein (DUF362 family)
MSEKLYRHLLRLKQKRRKMGLPPMSRREFLKAVAFTTAGLHLPFTSSCGSDDPDGGLITGPTPGNPVSAGIAREGDIVTTIRRAIDLAGGLGDIKGGDKVFIKPNLTGPLPNVCTNAEVIRGVIQAVAEHTDPRNITVAECSALGLPTLLFAGLAGYLAVCLQEGAQFLGWDSQEYVGFRDPDWRYIAEEKRIPRSLDPRAPEYDHFINVPILKNHEDCPHSNAVFTACIKSFVGILPFSGEGSRIESNIHDENLGYQAAELGRIVPRITMNVIDATTIALKNGPAGGFWGSGSQDGPLMTVNAGLVLASRDRVVCDTLGLAVLKHYAIQEGVERPYVHRSVWEDAQIKRAVELELGTGNPERVELVQEGVENFPAIQAQWR